jgi:hypothetical protein
MFKAIIPTLALVLLARSLPAMDGIAVTTVRSRKYSWDAQLMRYDIVNSKVARSTSIFEGSCYSPAFNMSGTFVAFIRGFEDKRWVSVVSVDGGEVVNLAEVVNHGRYQNLWWLKDGTIMYQGPDYEIRRLRMETVNGKLSVRDERAFYLQYEPQNDYVDMDLNGTVISFRIMGTPFNGGDKKSSSIIAPITQDPAQRITLNTPGSFIGWDCGNAISPSGLYAANYGGSGHTRIPMHRWPSGESIQGIDLPEDLPQWNTDKSDHMGTGGLANGWSVNSDRWMVASLGCDGRFAREGSDQFLINWQDKVAINTSKTCNSSEKKLVIRGDLWVQTPAEVNEDLRPFVTNREERLRHWSSLLSMPVAVAAPARRAPGGSALAAPRGVGAEYNLRGQRLHTGHAASSGQATHAIGSAPARGVRIVRLQTGRCRARVSH